MCRLNTRYVCYTQGSWLQVTLHWSLQMCTKTTDMVHIVCVWIFTLTIDRFCLQQAFFLKYTTIAQTKFQNTKCQKRVQAHFVCKASAQTGIEQNSYCSGTTTQFFAAYVPQERLFLAQCIFVYISRFQKGKIYFCW